MDPDDDMFLVIVGNDRDIEDIEEENPIQFTDHSPSEIKVEPSIEFYLEPQDGERSVVVMSESKLNKAFTKGVKINPSNKKYCSIPNIKHKNIDIDDGKYTIDTKKKCVITKLLEEYPELERNENQLIERLYLIMKSTKTPPLHNFFISCKEKFRCPICHHLTDTIPAAARHYQTKHGKRYLECYACGSDFRSTTNLYKHEKRCATPYARILLKARSLFIGRKGRGRPAVSLQLPACSVIKKPKLPKRGIIKNQFSCELCGATCQTRKVLESHQSLQHGKRSYQCDKCPATYAHRSTLERHMQTHSGQQYICDNCNRSFKSRHAIISHMEKHQPMKFVCECGLYFSQKVTLKAHIAKIHSEPQCVCYACGKRLLKISYLKKHMMRKHGLSLVTRHMLYKKMPLMNKEQLRDAVALLNSQFEIPTGDISSSDKILF